MTILEQLLDHHGFSEVDMCDFIFVFIMIQEDRRWGGSWEGSPPLGLGLWDTRQELMTQRVGG